MGSLNAKTSKRESIRSGPRDATELDHAHGAPQSTKAVASESISAIDMLSRTKESPLMRLTYLFLKQKHIPGMGNAASRAKHDTGHGKIVRLLETSLFTKCGEVSAPRGLEPIASPDKAGPTRLAPLCHVKRSIDGTTDASPPTASSASNGLRSDRRHSWASPRSGCCRTAQSRGAYARRRP